jgi:hypothetical protein
VTLEDCTLILAPLALALRAEMDVPTFTVYHRVLQKVPDQLLEMAVDALLQTPLDFMPTAPKLLVACEHQRRLWLAAHPHDGCDDCRGQRGFRNVVSSSGQRVVERCPCMAAHQQQLGGLAAPLALLPGEEVAMLPPSAPSVEQLPAEIQQRVREVVARKVMR